jgi:hypothetical protein
MFPNAEVIRAAGPTRLDLLAVVRMMSCVVKVNFAWACVEGSDDVVRLDAIVAACAAAQEARRPMVLSLWPCLGLGFTLSEGGGVAPMRVESRQAFEHLQALWTQQLQTLQGPCTVELKWGY